MLAMAVVIAWLVSGPMFGFSDTWQLIINTGTTIVTFLMVFLIQNTQNRDTRALQLKVDELIRASGRARNGMVTLEDRSEGELARMKSEFAELARRHPEAAEDLEDAREELEQAEGLIEATGARASTTH